MATTLTDKQPGVRVIVRERPFLDSEKDSNSNPRSCVSSEYLSTNEVSVLLKDLLTSRKECYKVDSFYGQQDENVSQIFSEEISPLLQWIFQGSNATVFAYGATGSGKTFTMQGTDELPGLMTLSMSSVLSLCEISGCSAEISYYEVYMDRCYDLLEPKTKEISVLDDKDGKVQLRGLSTVPIRSMVEFHEVLSSGIQRRKVTHTGLNDVSSRSHGVLVIVVTKTCTNGDDSTFVTTGKLNLIDLAGNEDNRRSCNDGIRIQESAKISQSLFALSNVIYALNNNKPRVPYRESKLTRILQDSLGGTSRSLMVACLNPGEYQESVYTVSLAARSRQFCNYASAVQNPETPKVKVDMEEKLRAWLDSKGKTKSTKRIAGLASPCASKTPIPMSSVKKRNLFQNSGKAACATYGRSISKPKERRMLNFEATTVSSVSADGLKISGSESQMDLVVDRNCVDYRLKSIDKTTNELGEDDKKIDICNGCTDVLESQACITDKFLEDSVKAPEDPNENVMVVSLANGNGSKIAERGSHKDLGESLNSVDDHLESFNKTGTNVWEEDGKETDTHNGCTNVLEPGACIIGKSLEEKMRRISVNTSETPLNSERVQTVTGSVRKALSPINSNVHMKQLEDLPPKVPSCLFVVEPSTPRAPSVLSHHIDETTESCTPLDRFCARSSNLKTTLVEEYISFLNAASKEQLLGFKGIGLKRAEYIIELREASPIKSLSDLENIGLSSKQVNDIFRRTARGIFD
ncbi:hypothetical protein MKW98_002316 [Papaver atlanticum]|uniref:Kinesin-like protein n=1 Tax=Papaver atlanticum TaxID=357466 RepID=A0AAD4X2W3_9MAGN|nr:hypothetical protein MKW98_002316 [Papaver atlanticum]